MLQNTYWPPVFFGTAKREGEWITAEYRLAKRTLLGDFQVKAWKKYSSYPKSLKNLSPVTERRRQQQSVEITLPWRRSERRKPTDKLWIYSATPWPEEKMTVYTERGSQSWVSHYEIMVMLRCRDKLPRCSQKKSVFTCRADSHHTYHTDPQRCVPLQFYSRTATRSKCAFPHSKEIAFV